MPSSPLASSMTDAELRQVIEAAWEDRAALSPASQGPVRAAVDLALERLDRGEARVAVRQGDQWVVNQWLKQAVLLSFRLSDMAPIAGAPGGANWWDKVPSKFDGMSAEDFRWRRHRRRP